MKSYAKTFNRTERFVVLILVSLILGSSAMAEDSVESTAGIFAVQQEEVLFPSTASGGPGGEKLDSTNCDIEINFDDVTVPEAFLDVTRLTEQYAGFGVHFEGPGGNNGGAVLNDSSWSISGHSSPNFLAFSTIGTLSDGGKPIGPEIIHVDESIVFFEAAFGAGSGGTLTLKAYDTAGYLVDTKTATLTAAVQRVRVMGRHIARVEFDCDANSWIMDDICIIKDGGAGILYLFDDCNGSSDFATPALTNLGYTDVTLVTDPLEFEFAIRTGTWDLIILENYQNVLADGVLDALYNYYVNWGGRILFSSYDLLFHGAHALLGSMGVSVVNSYDPPLPVYNWGSTALFDSPNTVPDLTLFQNTCTMDGVRLSVTTATAAAGYTASEQAGEAAVTINTDQRIIVNAFIPGLVDQDADSDGKNDMIALYENEIYFMTGMGGAALSADPVSLDFALPLEGVETQQATLENPSQLPIDWTSGTAKVLCVFADVPGPFLKELRREPGIGIVDYVNARYETPTLSTLLDYDVVIVASHYAFLDNNALGNVLADYVDAGGKVIHTSCASFGGYAVGGRFESGGYMAFNNSTATDFEDRVLGEYDAHPIMDGITALQNYFGFPVTLQYGADLIATWETGSPMVAVKGENIVGIDLFVIGLTPRYAGDVARLYRNAVLWLRGGSPLFIDPASGTLLPGETVTVDITADAAGLPLDYHKFFPVCFKGMDGGEAIVETSVLVTSTCMDDAAFAQRPHMPSEAMWMAHTSSETSPHTCYENFSGLTEPVAALRWWGIDLAWLPGFSECDRVEPDEYRIGFYTDNAGQPDVLVKELTVQATVTDTGLLGQGLYNVKEYEAVLSEKVRLDEGWVSIAGVEGGTCWFLWGSSPEGDGISMQVTDENPPVNLGIDRALCIVTDPECAPLADIACDSVTSGTTVGEPAFIDAYPCGGGDASGPEAVYRFVHADDGQVEIYLTDIAVDLNLYLLEGTCLPGQCVAFGDDAITHTVSAGTEYFVVVDGADAAGGDFVLHLECPVEEGEGEPPVEGEGEPLVEGEGEPLPPESLEAAAQALLDAFDVADIDESGGLSEAEAVAALPGLTHEQFVSLDINGDGELTRDELNQFLDAQDGCCGQGCQGCGPEAKKMDEFRRFLGDYLLVGLSIVGVLLLGGTRRKW